VTGGKEMPKPLISVTMATLNAESYLREQLDSILSQTLRPAEIIVCDDCSTDDTIKILQNYQDQNLLRFYTNGHRLGVVGNFKKAVSLTSESDFIALADQDDIWLPHKLELAAEKLKSIEDKMRPSIVYSDLILVDKNGNTINPSFRNELGQDKYKHSLKTLLFGNFVNGCTVLMNQRMKEFFATIPDHIVLNHDAWIALIAYTFGKVDIVSDSLIKYRKHEDNATGVSTLKKKNRYQRVKSELGSVWSERAPYLLDQLALVRKFYDTFESQLSEGDKLLIKRFLRLENSSYLKKKITMRLFFKGQWL
jgi:glycosyltransferase involved in cell wall biosynthesis